jgi:hypothetical protein
MTTSNSGSGSPKQAPAPISFRITIFPNVAAATKTSFTMTVKELATHIALVTAKRKEGLPLLKLASFGDVPTTKNSLRHDANMGDISGVEIEHDKGPMKLEEALTRLDAFNISYVAYHTPRHTPDEPHWRILLPTSREYAKTARSELVARLNGLLDSQLARESFVPLSQTFYYGIVRDTLEQEVIYIEGEYFDTIEALRLNARWPGDMTPTIAGQSKPIGQWTEAKMAALEKHRDPAHRNGQNGWHDLVRDYSCSLAARGYEDEEIRQLCAPYCNEGADDEDLTTLLDGPRINQIKRRKAPTTLLRQLKAQIEGTAQPAPAPGETPPDNCTIELPPEPKHTAPMDEKVQWLLTRYGYVTHKAPVIDLYATKAEPSLSIQWLRDRYLSWRETKDVQKAKPEYELVTNRWQVHPHRIHPVGVVLAPNQPFPIFTQNGLVLKNLYRRPQHTGEGEIETFLDFMAHLLPDEVEREWCLDWIAHKWLHPEIPGSAIIMVAHGVFGAGRTLWGSIMHRLFGEDYTREQDFSILDGTNSQSRFTDWIHKVFTTVDEGSSHEHAHRIGERRRVYERLKRLADPAPVRRTIEGKGTAAVDIVSCNSLAVFTNHNNALALPVDDRRFAVLTNGRPLVEPLRSRILAWREQPGTIAALARYCEWRDLSRFDAQLAPMTEGKALMTEMAQTEAEQAMIDLKSDASFGKIFWREVLVSAITMRCAHDPYIKDYIKEAWQRHVVPVFTGNQPLETGNQPGRLVQKTVTIDGLRRRLFCFGCYLDEVTRMTQDQVDRELAKFKPVNVTAYQPLR